MTPDRFAQLKPILGDNIVPLQVAYVISDSEGRKEISFLLELLAHKVGLGITPPPKNISNGRFPLGYVVGSSKRPYPFSLREKDWFHVGVFGMTGRGKTNTVLHLLSSLSYRGVKWLAAW